MFKSLISTIALGVFLLSLQTAAEAQDEHDIADESVRILDSVNKQSKDFFSDSEPFFNTVETGMENIAVYALLLDQGMTETDEKWVKAKMYAEFGALYESGKQDIPAVLEGLESLSYNFSRAKIDLNQLHERTDDSDLQIEIYEKKGDECFEKYQEIGGKIDDLSNAGVPIPDELIAEADDLESCMEQAIAEKRIIAAEAEIVSVMAGYLNETGNTIDQLGKRYPVAISNNLISFLNSVRQVEASIRLGKLDMIRLKLANFDHQAKSLRTMMNQLGKISNELWDTRKKIEVHGGKMVKGRSMKEKMDFYRSKLKKPDSK